MPTTLDRRFDDMLAKVIGPGGRLVIERDSKGQAIVANFPATLPDFFRIFCALNGGVEAIVAGPERLTFADLERWSNQLAPALVRSGIKKGDRVGIAMRNCPAWVVTYMAALKAGAIATLLNGWWQSHELDHALKLTEPALILADAPRAKRIAAIGGDWNVVSLDVDLPLAEALAPLLEGGGDPVELPAITPDDDATILFTSGSTGEAKGALSTHRAVTTGVYAYSTGLMTLLGLLTEEGRPPPNPPRTLLSVPLFHVTGEVPVLLNSFVIGRGMVLMPKWDAEEALRLIEAEKITYFVGVPTMSLELMNHPDRDKYDLSTLTDITAGGAPRPVDHVERLQNKLSRGQAGLGLWPDRDQCRRMQQFLVELCRKTRFDRPRTARPMSKSRSSAPNDAHLPPGERGEIAIKSAANIKCYWRNPEATAAAFTADGYFRTGDIGYLDDDGYLFIVDRKKDIIIRGGENISSQEVEAACYACPAVAEAAVFAAPDERLGEVPVAVLYLREGSDLDAAGLEGFPRNPPRRVQDPGADDLQPRPIAAARHRQDRPRRAESAVRALKLALPKVDRRALLIGGGAGVGLVVAFALWPRDIGSGLRARPGEGVFDHFLKIGSDGRVTVVVPQVETGQGIWTALPQILADELGAAWENVAVEPAPSAPAYANRLADEEGWLEGVGPWREHQLAADGALRITAGSTSIRAFELPLRQAGAAARAMLTQAAANRWGVAAAECDSEGGFIVHEGKRLGFGELAVEASRLTPPAKLSAPPDRHAASCSVSRCRASTFPPRATAARASPATCACPACFTPRSALPHSGGRLTGFSRAGAQRVPGIVQDRRPQRLAGGGRAKLVGGRARPGRGVAQIHRPGAGRQPRRPQHSRTCARSGRIPKHVSNAAIMRLRFRVRPR